MGAWIRQIASEPTTRRPNQGEVIPLGINEHCRIVFTNVIQIPDFQMHVRPSVAEFSRVPHFGDHFTLLNSLTRHQIWRLEQVAVHRGKP